jgi:hypothetical protein
MWDGDRSLLVMSRRRRLLGWATVAAGHGFEGFDDDHAPAAARTNIPLFLFVTTVHAIGVGAAGSWVWCAEKATGQCNDVGLVSIGEEAVVTDTMKSVGSTWIRKRRQLVGVERHKLVAGVGLAR